MQPQVVKALRFIEAARAWPEHLGVGRPFDTDERLENYLAAAAYERAGDKGRAKMYYESVAADTLKLEANSGASRYFGAVAMTRLDRRGEAERLIQAWRTQSPDCPIAAWASARLAGDEKKAAGILAELEASVPGYPWSLARYDREFPVVLEFERLIGGAANSAR